MNAVITMTLSDLKGVGPSRLNQLHEQGIHSLKALIETLPRRYDVRSIKTIDSVEAGETAYLKGTIQSDVSVFFIRKNLSRLTFKAAIDGHSYTVAVFNQHYLRKTLNKGDAIVLHAKAEPNKSTLTAQKVIRLDHFKSGITPVYNISGIGDATVQKLIEQALQRVGLDDPIPPHILSAYHYPAKRDALLEAHHPSTMSALRKALSRLRYETLLIYQLRVKDARQRRKHQKGASKTFHEDLFEAIKESLPFSLSTSQTEAVGEIMDDLRSPSPMRRMLQGDTGSGKTIVALLAAYATIRAGYQVAFMAPTEILAHQQYDEAAFLLGNLGIRVDLLTQGSQNSAQTIQALKTGDCDLVVGTHRLFSSDIEYSNLGLVITDEQHRFGVEQRKKLSSKGEVPDILYLSATPIPRTLAMTLFGDMDISTIERPNNRAKAVTTAVRTMRSEKAAMNAIGRRLGNQEQVYVVAPTIDEQESLTGVKALYKKYQKHFKGYTVSVLHGRLKSGEKARVLKAFKEGHVDILITTTVVEVGIHAPGATLMVIYHGERFGYAQLHQLRGRVGREGAEGACVILAKDDPEIMDRLKILETTHDGFELSDIDLKRRGFGDLVGTSQSGTMDILRDEDEGDLALFEQARLDAEVLMDHHLNKKDSSTSRLIDHVRKVYPDGGTV
ncbi:MAG: ATP-dependent DNA helicase RecG [Bacillota bacterium]